MPRVPRYTERVFVDITPSMRRQLDRLAGYHERSVPDLVRHAIAQAYGPPSDQDRQPQLLETAKKAPSGGNKRRKTQKG